MLSLFLQKPTVEFCEKPIAGIIKRPFYALSNLSFIIAGVLIFQKGKGNKLSKIFGSLSIVIGTCSFFYDSSYTYISQILDLAAMFVFVMVLLLLNISAIVKLKQFARNSLFTATLVIPIVMINILKGRSGEFLFALYVVILIAAEIYLLKIGKHKNIKNWLVGLVLFLIGFIFWIPDATGIFCNPIKLLNGRAIFHYFTATTIYYLYLFYENQEKAIAL